jgi:hypothetical protein
MFEPPINSFQTQNQFSSWNFNSNSVSNLNFLPNVKLFIMNQATIIQSLDNFAPMEGLIWYFTNLSEFE